MLRVFPPVCFVDGLGFRFVCFSRKIYDGGLFSGWWNRRVVGMLGEEGVGMDMDEF